MKYKYGLLNDYIKYRQKLLSSDYIIKQITNNMKYKIGDILKIKNIDECGNAKSSDAVYVKIIAVGDISYSYNLLDANKNKVGDPCICFKDNDLEPINRPIEDVREGDKIVDTDGDVREVLGVCGQMVFTTHFNKEYTDQTDGYEFTTSFTIKELIGKGMKILQEPQESETVEMTVAEVAEKLGLKGKLKIKE